MERIKGTDANFSCVCPVINNEFCHYMWIKEAIASLTML